MVFHRSAVGELAGPRSTRRSSDSLLALVRRDLIRPDAADFAGEEAYRFRHVLIRDAAYRSLSEERPGRPARALRRLARADRRDRLREFEEIVGYHLEQAYRYRIALGIARLARRCLAARASAAARGGRPAGARPQRPARRRSACSSG